MAGSRLKYYRMLQILCSRYTKAYGSLFIPSWQMQPRKGRQAFKGGEWQPRKLMSNLRQEPTTTAAPSGWKAITVKGQNVWLGHASYLECRVLFYFQLYHSHNKRNRIATASGGVMHYVHNHNHVMSSHHGLWTRNKTTTTM